MNTKGYGDMSKRTKAASIPPKVKDAVFERDDHKCIWCGHYGYRSWACAHWISRAQGGLGIEENILTLCPDCHREYDNGTDREGMKEYFRQYLSYRYKREIREKDVKYNKWKGIFDD